ncbi:MAG: CDP-diacylglycerol--glycerol-3-phosphate 3-phosphatidyltransferase [Candidatus Shapirobacteria bacterium]|nr:CDP-diacylglycerol--glycerol-3-phosphate 3-phosphatidyltransferase [Candidatus Shapirobacteria bacterium]MDD4382572.1 CDP-diacylglycerol--glycerol-3-phosphate 3-phosphatidyltransferase [Candidatus Shapirobacteria bacterium]
MNIANKLTVSRIFLIPFFLVSTVVAWKIQDAWWLVAAIYFLSGLTDLLDGPIARYLKQVTDFGATFDPIADKLTMVAGLLIANESGLLTFWVLWIVFSREFLVDFIRLLIKDKNNEVVSASNWGKAKTFSQYVGLIMLFISASGVNWLLIPGQLVMYTSTAIAIIGLIGYRNLFINKKNISKKSE